MIPAEYNKAREALTDEMCCKIVEDEARLLIKETVDLIEHIKKVFRIHVGVTIFLLLFHAWLLPVDDLLIANLILLIASFLVGRKMINKIKYLKKSLSYLFVAKSNGSLVCRIVSEMSCFIDNKSTFYRARLIGIHLIVNNLTGVLLHRCASQMEKNELNERSKQWLSVAKRIPR